MLIKPGTLSKDPTMYGLPKDTRITDALGSRIQIDYRAKWLTDWPSGLGTNLFGYKRFSSGRQYSPSLVTSQEYNAANALSMFVCRLLRWDDAGVVFCKTGSEATDIAVRVARAVTGRDRVMTFMDAYHGWHDWTIQRTEPARGVIKDHAFTQALWGDEIQGMTGQAATIFEHPPSKPKKSWVEYVNNLDGLLIADEVVTGLRYQPGLISARYGYKPDIICLGKGIGNGASIAAVVGRLDIMKDAFDTDHPVFCSSTTWGEVSALDLVTQVMTEYPKLSPDYINHIGEKARYALGLSGFKTWGDNERFLVDYGTDEERGAIIRGFVAEGHLVNRPYFATYAHTLEDATDLGRAGFEVINNISKYKNGPTPKVLFRSR